MLENYGKDKKNEIIYPSFLAGNWFIIVICLIFMLTIIISPAYAEPLELIKHPQLGSATAKSIFELYIPFANNLTAGNYNFHGRNASEGAYGIYDYNKVSGTTCSNIKMQFGNVPRDYAFDLDVTWTASAHNTYSSNYTLAYTIKNLQAPNLTSRTGYFYNAQTTGIAPCDVMIQDVTNLIALPEQTKITNNNNWNNLTIGGSGYFLVGYYDSIESSAPISVNSSYTNLTINVKALGTTTNIENSLIYIIYPDSAMYIDRTDNTGNASFNFLPTSITDISLDAYAVGYGYYSEQYKLTDLTQFKQIYLSPQGLPNSSNYMKVNVLDSLTNKYLSDLNVNLSVTDLNVSETYYEILPTGSGYVTLTGSAKNRPLVYDDSYNFAASATGYSTNNLTVKYVSSAQVVDLYLTPTSAYLNPKEMWVDVIDPATGEGNTVGGSTVKLYDQKLNQWANSTTATGQISLTMSGTNKQEPIVIGRNYTLCASATGYSQACIGPFLFGAPYSNDNESVGKIPYQIGLTFNGIIPTGNFSCNVYTIDGSSYLAIQNVAVLASNGQGQTSSTSGVTQFILPAGTYSFKTSKSGYTSSTGTITGIAGDTKSVTIPMFQNTITYATTSPTPKPTVTGVGGTIRNITPAVCGGEYSNILGYFKSYIACWGAEDRYSQDLALAAIIILVCMFFGARFGRGLGSAIGAAVGFVLSIAAQLIDVWVFFALIIIAGLIFGLKLYMGDK